MTSFNAVRFQNKVYKLQKQLEELKLKQEDENRFSKLIISRNEIVDIFESVVPKYVAMKISSYHRHPIDEFIGEDKLKHKGHTLSVFLNCGVVFHYCFPWISPAHRSEYLDTKVAVRRRTNYNLSTSSRLRIFYPYTRRALNTGTKQHIYQIAQKHYIKLSMSWKKDKMIDEFFKRS